MHAEHEHTPGPWQVWHLAADADTYGQNAGKPIIVAGPEAETEVCSVVHRGADAALIAAAPEMLAALELLESGMKHRAGDCYSNDYWGVCCCGLDVVRAAIRKARGTEPNERATVSGAERKSPSLRLPEGAQEEKAIRALAGYLVQCERSRGPYHREEAEVYRTAIGALECFRGAAAEVERLTAAMEILLTALHEVRDAWDEELGASAAEAIARAGKAAPMVASWRPAAPKGVSP